MALKPINPRLRVINKSNDVAKVDLRVAPGDVLEVSADVAAQLGAEFADAGTVSKAEAEVLDTLAAEPTEAADGAPAKPAKRTRKAPSK